MYSFCTHRLILIGEKETVYKKFSTPLINRLEKHFVLASSVLEDWQRALLESFEQWIRKFSRARLGFLFNTYCTFFFNSNFLFLVIPVVTNLRKPMLSLDIRKILQLL